MSKSKNQPEIYHSVDVAGTWIVLKIVSGVFYFGPYPAGSAVSDAAKNDLPTAPAGLGSNG